MKKAINACFSIIFILTLAFLVSDAAAYETYTDCSNCHGGFTAASYSSLAAAKVANPAWSGGLHNLHRNSSTQSPAGMLNGNCNACHFGTSRATVYMYQSSAAAPFNQSCSGCHDGPGLRAHHENSGADTCYDCHSDPAPDPENMLRPVYAAAMGTTSGTTGVNNPCSSTAAGFEGRLADVATIGLDNDGNLLYDQNDPACAAPAAKLAVSPTSLTFGNQNTGSTSATKTVTVSNTGTAALNVTGITNSNTTDFVLTAASTPFNIAAGGSQTFTVAFKPGSAGAKTATISIASNGGNATVGATGTGVAPPQPVLGVSPTSLSFGNQTLGSTSAAKTVTISNTGTGTLNITGISSSNAEFAFSPASISPIAAGGSATLSVTFAPAAPAGTKSANISILSTGGNATVGATGTGVAAAALSVSPATLAYGNQTVGTTSAVKTVTISNTGGTALTVNSITNANTTDFVLIAPATPFTVNGGASQTFSLAFKPAAGGAKSASISVVSTAGSATVDATGTGTATAAALSVSPVTLAYANQTVGTTSAVKTVTISNTGGTALTVNSITNGNTTDFVLTAPAVPFTVNGGASQTFTLAFKPAAGGAKSASISVVSTAGSATVDATGTGVTIVSQPVLNVSPASLSFTNVTVGAPATKTVTISNTGNAALNIANMTLAGSTAFSFSPSSLAPIAAGANATLTVTYSPTVVGTDSGATLDITSNGGNASVSLTGNAVQQSAGDVALVKLRVPQTITEKVGEKADMNVIAEATTTANFARATVTLTASASEGVGVRIDENRRSKDLRAIDTDPKRFKFETKITCTKPGTWPVTWTARINSSKNSDTANDVLIRTTQVTCSRDGEDEEDDD